MLVSVLEIHMRVQHFNPVRLIVNRRAARVRQALRVRTGKAVGHSRRFLFQVDDARQEDIVNFLVTHQVVDMPQSDLHRKARLGNRSLRALVDDPLVGAVGQHDAEAQLAQKRMEERIQVMEEQRPWHPYSRRVLRHLGIPCVRVEQHLLALFEQVRQV